MHNTQEDCIVLLEQFRWGGQPRCPYCSSIKAAQIKRENRYHCNDCFTSYSVTVGTLFHRTHVRLDKWFQAIGLVFKRSPNISVRQLAGEINVDKNTAAYMINRIKSATREDLELLEKILTWLEELEC